MKLREVFLSCFLACSLMVSAMSDQQVIDYIKQQTAAGKKQEQIGKELMAKGVTQEQAKRIKKILEAQQNVNSASPTSTSIKETRTHGVSKVADNGTGSIPTSTHNPDTTLNTEVLFLVGDNQVKKDIFGHNVFNNEFLSFEPSENLATPQDYRLGPGDEVLIDIWGASEDHIRQTISPEGNIMISQVGPVYLNGLTINDANKHIRNTFSRKYAGMGDEQTDVQLTLGQVRTIQVDVLGELVMPGTFRLSPFSTVFHALYSAGGINDIGTLRDIQVLRNGKIVARIDIYDYLFNGNSQSNIRLQEGDVIIVHPYEELVNIKGNVKRPMYYELKQSETLNDLLQFAGGMTGDAYEGIVSIERQSGTENELYNIDRDEFSAWPMKDGDIVTVGSVLDRFANRVEVKGAIYRPGKYAITDDMATIGDLISKADGVTDDAFLDRVLLYREGPDLKVQLQAFNLKDILDGTHPDVALKRNDVLVISSVMELEEQEPTVFIGGQIGNWGEYPYAENMTVEDLIIMAGGLKDGASTVRIDVSRRIVDPTSTVQTEKLAQVFTISLENGLASGDGKEFVLKPFDFVVVRKSPGYSPQRKVTLDGAILFEGVYVLERRNERITDLLKRAGGVIDEAYVRGAYLTRQLTNDEYEARKEALRAAQANAGNVKDSIAISKIDVSPYYNVGIDLEKALQHPGSSYDVVMRDGDMLFVPEQQSTVKISGDVLYPNAVVYVPGKKLDYYIDQAGGYGQSARKGKAFIVYLNGSVTRAKRNTVIEPGCQIIVPSKPANSGTDWTKILTLATSFSSVATMAATITNIFKK